MSEKPREVLIDGVRYVPAAEISAGLEDFKQALLDQFWGKGYRPEGANEGRDVYVMVYDDAEGFDNPPTVKEFIEQLAADLAGAQ